MIETNAREAPVERKKAGAPAVRSAPAEAFRRSGFLRYLFALIVTAGATLATIWAQPLLQRTVVAAYLPALILVAWYAGRGPALLTLALAAAVANVFLVPPVGSLAIASPADAVPLLVLFAVGSLIIGVSHLARRGEDELRVRAVELEEQAEELEQQMEAANTLQVEVELANEQLELVNRDLERNREFLEQAQRSARLGSWEWHIDRNEVLWSDELYRVYGLEPGSVAVTFETFTAAVHPDDRAMVVEAVQEALRTRTAFSFDHRIVLPSGAVRWLEARGRVHSDEAGNPVRMVGSGQDITERRRASEAQRFLAEAGHALSSSLDYTITLRTIANLVVRELADWCAVAIGDSSGHYRNIAVAHRDPERVAWAEEWSRTHPPQFDAATGVAQVLRTRKSELYPVIPAEMLERSVASEEELAALRSLGLHSAMIVPMIARDRVLGAITFVSAESKREFNEDDLWVAERLAGRSALAIDNARLFDEAREARETAEHANRAKMDFLAAMSHELRTPLNAIAGYAQLLEIGLYGVLSEEQRDVVARLQRSQHHLLGLVEQVLGFARIEAGEVQMDLAEVSVSETVAKASEMTAPQVALKRLDFRCEYGEDDLRVLADPDRLQQILVNLLSNAVKFTEEGGQVTVDCRPEDSTVAVTVTDTGVGIPADKLDIVFEPFAQLPQAREKRSAGVGLGLAISRDLARAMGGEITVASALGKGSTFKLTLPRARQ